MKKSLISFLCVALTLCFCCIADAQIPTSERVGGTLIVSVPVQQGLVTCSDKRLFNETTGTFRDDSVKIHRVGSNALFVATSTTGFLDRSTGKIEFDAFEVVSHFTSEHEFIPGQLYWDGLKKEITGQLLQFLAKRNYKDWPVTDVANNKLLFNLVFFSVTGETVRSYSMPVFYEKAPTPVIYIPDAVSETVNTPKLLGKGKIVMSYLARKPELSHDPSIMRFDQSEFDIRRTSAEDAVNFAKSLFLITNTALPQAKVSETYDCALISYQYGFEWLEHRDFSVDNGT